MLVQDKQIEKMVNEGAILGAKIKAMEKEFNAIKEELKGTLDKGTYVTKQGKSLSITCSKKWSTISPEDAKAMLRTKRLGRNFLNCVKINLTELRKLLTDKEVDTLRVSAGTTISLSFK